MRVFRVVLFLANGALFAWACVMWIERPPPPSSLTDWVMALALTSVPFMNLIYHFFFSPRPLFSQLGFSASGLMQRKLN
jgi:hypothetical protein